MATYLRTILYLLVLLAGSQFAATASAHYLFVRILPPAEGGRAAEVYFSEKAAAGDPRYVDIVATTKLWMQSTPGNFLPLEVIKATDRLRAHLPRQGNLSVVGVWDYGVLARPGQPPFLLRHYPKAVAGAPAELNSLEPRRENRLEIMPRFESDKIVLTVLRDGKALPSAEIHTVDDNLVGDTLQADAAGQATFTPPSTGVYSVYTSFVEPQAGEHDGKRYEEIREFATVAFTWPLQPAGADAAAGQLLAEAQAARAVWRDFPGFEADLNGNVAGREISGTVRVARDGTVTVDAAGEPVAGWVQEQIASIYKERVAPSGAAPSATVRFADDDTEHPRGRLIAIDADPQSASDRALSYRVKDKQITVENRQSGDTDVTISLIENSRNAAGAFLPHSYAAQYWENATGRLDRTETVQTDWLRVGAFDLPYRHSVVTAARGGISVRGFELSNHKLLETP